MVAINGLANSLPINGIMSGEVSDMYPNLFAPAGITFSIWALIYSLLGVFVIYQFNNLKIKSPSTLRNFFILTSSINFSWIFAWHYDYIGLSTILIISLLLLLKKITNDLAKNKLNLIETFTLSVPFNLYLGWITIATIANMTTFLVSQNWPGFGLSSEIWTILVLIFGASIGIYRFFYSQSRTYLLVFVWAYSGILYKHVSSQWFAGRFPGIISILILSLFSFVTALIFNKKIKSVIKS